MVNEKKPELKSGPSPNTMEDRLNTMLVGVERNLAVTCEQIMKHMQQIEDKIQDMETRCSELAKDAVAAIKMTGEGEEPKTGEAVAESADDNAQK